MPTSRIKQAARLVGVSPDTLRRWADRSRVETTTDAGACALRRAEQDGSAVRYVQLVQNEWDPATKSSRMRWCTASAGRTSWTGPRSAAGRVAGRLLARSRPGAPELAYAGSVAYGGTYLLDQLWQRLGSARP